MQFFAPLLLLFMVVSLLIVIGRGKTNVAYEGGNGVDEDTWAYLQCVVSNCEKYGAGEYVHHVLAIIQVESGGKGRDVMQSLTYSGLLEEEKTPWLSIEYGVAYFADCVARAKAAGCDMNTAIQAYNYGTGYIDYVAARGKEHEYTLASSFASKQCGGEKVIYNNPLAIRTNGGWRYAYGNMFYVYLVRQYMAADPMDEGTADTIIREALKYKGYPYVWGGSSPETSFDCSGLVQWCCKTAGIGMPRTAQEQYNRTHHIKLEEAAPGDLVFFTGTRSGGNYITHVGIYVGNNKMFHAGNPLGYADLSGRYWQKHLVCAGRIK